MDTYSPQIAKLIKCFRKMPARIGAKSAEKYAMSIMDMTEDEVNDFAASLIAAKRELHYCPKCQNWTNEDLCPICKSEYRNKKLIMVVETPRDVVNFERAGYYNGTYHVLHGLISQKDRVDGSQIKLRELIERLKDDVDELILALSPTYDGLTTSNEIKKLLEGSQIKITCLAQGVPTDSNLENVGASTLEQAFNNRV
jgi:recombination protein RecR